MVFFTGNGISMDFVITCYWPKQYSPLHSLLKTLVSLWVKIRHRKKPACFELNPVKSKKGSLLRFHRFTGIKQHCHFEWLHGIMSENHSSGMILNQLQPKIASKTVAIEMRRRRASTFDSAQWALSKKCAEGKSFNSKVYVECNIMCWSKVCLEVWCILSGLDIWLAHSIHENSAWNHQFKVARYDQS